MRHFRFVEHMSEAEKSALSYNGLFVPHFDHLAISDSDSLESLIYAPDPVTGVPCSNLSMLLNENTRPEVESFIRNTFSAKLPPSPGNDNPDLVLEMIKDSRESFIDYANRLREICNQE